MYEHERSLVKKMKDRPFELVGVNSDKDKEKLAKRMEEEKITWKSFWNGEQGTGGPISKDWKVTGWPTIVLIDHKGVIRRRFVGSPPGEELDKIIEALVKEAEVK